MLTKNQELLFTVPQAAEALSLKAKTIRAWIGARRIGYITVQLRFARNYPGQYQNLKL